MNKQQWPKIQIRLNNNPETWEFILGRSRSSSHICRFCIYFRMKEADTLSAQRLIVLTRLQKRYTLEPPILRLMSWSHPVKHIKRPFQLPFSPPPLNCWDLALRTDFLLFPCRYPSYSILIYLLSHLYILICSLPYHTLVYFISRVGKICTHTFTEKTRTENKHRKKTRAVAVIVTSGCLLSFISFHLFFE